MIIMNEGGGGEKLYIAKLPCYHTKSEQIKIGSLALHTSSPPPTTLGRKGRKCKKYTFQWVRLGWLHPSTGAEGRGQKSNTMNLPNL